MQRRILVGDAIVIALLLTIVYLFSTSYLQGRKKTYPPGPPSKWIIGNLFHLPVKSAWCQFTSWRKTYGDIMHFHGLGNNIVVLNSLEAVNELLDKRGSYYSHRPIFTMSGELMGLNETMVSRQYGNEWRAQRKLANTVFSSEAIKKYQTMQEDIAVLLSQSLISQPRDFFNHVKLAAGRLILAITYGIPTDVADTKFIPHLFKTMERITLASIPGTYLVDFIPQMKYLPPWLPGTSFLEDARVSKNMILKMMQQPFDYTLNAMRDGVALPSFTQDALTRDMPAEQIDEDVIQMIKWTAVTLFGAGSDTTAATLLVFVLVMALNPDKQKLAQEELDRVVGSDRLPTLEDRNNLPYVDAVVKEIFRWHPVAPLGLPRRVIQDDTYRGYDIESESFVISNIWSIAEIECGGYDPSKFIPERHLQSDKAEMARDPRTFVFGFGRRICPGRLFADNTVFTVASIILSCFSILPPLGADGKEETIHPHFDEYLVSAPEEFKCRIKLRDPSKKQLIDTRVQASNI